MVSFAARNQIRRLHADGLRDAEVARRVGCCRATVRTYLDGFFGRDRPGRREKRAPPPADNEDDPPVEAHPIYGLGYWELRREREAWGWEPAWP